MTPPLTLYLMLNVAAALKSAASDLSLIAALTGDGGHGNLPYAAIEHRISPWVGSPHRFVLIGL
jgi:hypothetical protein